jgi:hypothetical protein
MEMHTFTEAMAVTCDLVAAAALFAFWVQHGLADASSGERSSAGLATEGAHA